MRFEDLSPIQLDALKEIGNIGAGNAATALSTLLNKRIDMTVPKIDILPFNEVVEIMGGAESLVAGGYLEVKGEAPMSILFVIPEKSVSLFMKILLGKEMKSIEDFDEMSESVIKEVTNILAGSYLNSLGMFTNLVFEATVPALAYDMSGAIIGNVLQLYGEVSDYSFVIESVFLEEEVEVKGHFFLLPGPDSLYKILERLGVS
ncbi:MAG: chemotaxis protein CheC [Clostridia bacterium]|nr:chemotaxis protein CheC [Clostridia bacterium]